MKFFSAQSNSQIARQLVTNEQKKCLLRFHLRPVVVVLVDGAPIGKIPQCGPSTDDSI